MKFWIRRTFDVSGVVARMGTQQMAVYSLLVTVGNMVELPIYAYATATQTYALQNKAAGSTDQAEQYIRIGRRFTFGVIICLSILCFICKTQVFGLVVSDETVIEQAGHLLLWVLVIAFSKIAYQFYMGYLQGAGKEKYIFISAVISTVISSIAVFLLGELFALIGVYLVMCGKYFILSVVYRRQIRLLGEKTLMQYEDLIERVGWGEEFLFEYHGEKYWISQNPNGRYLTRESDGYSQEFKTTYELFNNAKIEGKSILQIWDEIKNQF